MFRPTLAWNFKFNANRNPSFKERLDKVKVQRQLEFADVLKTLFARRRLVPKIDPLQMATGFAALWSGFAVQGDVSWAKPFDQVFLVFLRALLDNSIPVEEGDGGVESETGNNLVGSAATGEDSDSSLLEMKRE